MLLEDDKKRKVCHCSYVNTPEEICNMCPFYYISVIELNQMQLLRHTREFVIIKKLKEVDIVE
jgi:hypothetical protein